MNANELADELQAVLFACGKERPFLEHAKMLLQQQAEIEALKRDCINYLKDNTRLSDQILLLKKDK